MSKRPRAKRRSDKAASGASLYVACFRFDQDGLRGQRTGTFQIVVEATSPDEADDRCRARLTKLRATTTLFERATTIYLDGFVALTGSLAEGLLVNWDSTDVPADGSMRLSCLMPAQGRHEAIEYRIEPDDVGPEEAFLDFGGKGERVSGLRLTN